MVHGVCRVKAYVAEAVDQGCVDMKLKRNLARRHRVNAIGAKMADDGIAGFMFDWLPLNGSGKHMAWHIRSLWTPSSYPLLTILVRLTSCVLLVSL